MRRAVLMLAAVGLLGAAAAGMSYLAYQKAAPRPPAGPAPRPDRPETKRLGEKAVAPFPPDDWTHKELAAFLAQKGVKVDVSSVPLLSRGPMVAAWFAEGRPEDGAGVVVYLCPTEKDAREQAGALGGAAFAKGRFAFGGTPFTSNAAAVARGAAVLRRLARALE